MWFDKLQFAYWLGHILCDWIKFTPVRFSLLLTNDMFFGLGYITYPDCSFLIFKMMDLNLMVPRQLKKNVLIWTLKQRSDFAIACSNAFSRFWAKLSFRTEKHPSTPTGRDLLFQCYFFIQIYVLAKWCTHCFFISHLLPIQIWSRKWQPTTVFLPGKFHGQRSLAGYSSWGFKESDTTEHASSAHLDRLQVFLPERPFPGLPG